MQIYTRGKSDSVSRKELKYATNWYASMLMSKRLTNNLTIEIHLVKMKDFRGLATWTEYGRKLREFRIDIDPRQNRKQTLMTLAHEMVHVKQYATGELRDHVPGVSKWKKELFNEQKTHYYDLPWEIEAHGREFGLYVRYIEHLSDNKISF